MKKKYYIKRFAAGAAALTMVFAVSSASAYNGQDSLISVSYKYDTNTLGIPSEIAQYLDKNLLEPTDNPNLTNVKEENNSGYNYYTDENGKYGLKLNDNIIVQAVWDDIMYIDDFRTAQATPDYDHLSGFTVDRTSQAHVIGDIYNTYSVDKDKQLASVKKDGKWGCLRISDNTLVLPCEYKEAFVDGNNQIRTLSFDDKYGYADLSGTVKVAPKYDYAEIDSGMEYNVVGRDYGYTIIDGSGNEMTTLMTQKPEFLDENYFYTLDSNKKEFTLYNINGKKMFTEENCSGVGCYADGIFELHNYIYDESAKVRGVSDKVMDVNGNVIIDSPDYNSYFISQVKSKYATKDIDDYPVVIIATKYISDDYSYIYLDRNGNKLTDDITYSGDYGLPQYPLLPFKKDNKFGYIDRNGKVVFEPIFEDARYPFVKKDGKVGVINENGEYIISPSIITNADGYNELYDCNVISDGKSDFYRINITDSISYSQHTSLYDSAGTMIMPPIYAYIEFDPYGKLRFYSDSPTGQDKTIMYSADLKSPTIPQNTEDYVTTQKIQEATIIYFAGQGVITNDLKEQRLNENITRAEFLTMLSRAKNWNVQEAEPAFSDTNGHWANSVIALAKNMGLVSGDETGYFNPDDNITYKEAFTIMLRSLGVPCDNLTETEFSGAVGKSKISSQLKTMRHQNESYVTREFALMLLSGYLFYSPGYVYTKDDDNGIINYNNQLMGYYFY